MTHQLLIQHQPLSSWNEGANRQAIIDYVRLVTDPNSSHFVPVPERIAAFDFDGTLVGGSDGKGKYPHYIGMPYQPMRELVEFLQQNTFTCWIVSGSSKYRIKKHAMTKYRIEDHCLIGDVGYDAKVTSIEQISGFKPIFVAGDGGNDYAMLRSSRSHQLLTMQLLISHDDADREIARQTTEFIDTAKTENWNIISMKTDWKTMFASVDDDVTIQSQTAFDKEIGLVRRRATIPFLDSTYSMNIDGNLDKPVYRNFPWLEPFIGYAQLEGSPRPIEAMTKAFAAYDENNLYIAFDCSEPNMATQQVGGENVWKGETIEISILQQGQPTNDPKAIFYHFILTTANDRWESIDIGESASPDKYNPVWESATAKQSTSWTAEIAIPWKELGLSSVKVGKKFMSIWQGFAKTSRPK